MPSPAQQALHLARPVFFLDLNQRLEFTQVMRIAQRVQHALQGIIRPPVVMDDNADDVVRQAAPLGGDAVERQQHGRCDVQPLRPAADPKAGLVEVLHRRCRDMIAQRGGKPFEPRGTGLAHGGDGRRRQVHTEQIGHQFGQALLRQQLVVQQVDDKGRDPGAVLHRCSHACGKCRARLLAAGRAVAPMGAVFGHDQRLRFRQVEHLPGGMAGGHRLAQGRATVVAGRREIIDRDIRRLGAAQRFARVPLLPAGLLA